MGKYAICVQPSSHKSGGLSVKITPVKQVKFSLIKLCSVRWTKTFFEFRNQGQPLEVMSLLQ